MAITLTMPSWAQQEIDRLPERLPDPVEQMHAVIRFSRLNFERDTGGPFAAGVFEQESGRLIAMGVNRVTATTCSSAHAEIMALSLAQKSLGTYDLSSGRLAAQRLVVNWRPCAMCYGAVIWSGVRSLMIAGSGPELEQLTGFDEGPIHPDWRAELAKRKVQLTEDVLRAEAIAVFREFGVSNRAVYNPARSGA